jgi:hypothetical protein
MGSRFCLFHAANVRAGQFLYSDDVHRSFLGTWKVMQGVFGNASDLIKSGRSCTSSYLVYLHLDVGRVVLSSDAVPCSCQSYEILQALRLPGATRQARVTTWFDMTADGRSCLIQ